MIRFDGLYRSDVVDDGGSGYRTYIRFYDDGTVITQSVIEPAAVADIMPWFVRDRPATSQGKYTVDGDKLQFNTVFSSGFDYRDGTSDPDIVVNYDGTMSPDRIVVSSVSSNGNKTADREYVFSAP